MACIKPPFLSEEQNLGSSSQLHAHNQTHNNTTSAANEHQTTMNDNQKNIPKNVINHLCKELTSSHIARFLLEEECTKQGVSMGVIRKMAKVLTKKHLSLAKLRDYLSPKHSDLLYR